MHVTTERLIWRSTMNTVPESYEDSPCSVGLAVRREPPTELGTISHRRQGDAKAQCVLKKCQASRFRNHEKMIHSSNLFFTLF